MSQQTAFRLRSDVVRSFSELQVATGKNKTLLLHEAVRYYHKAYKAGLLPSNTKNNDSYTVKNIEKPTKLSQEVVTDA